MIKTNFESLIKQKLRGEIIHPELWTERHYVITWEGKPKLTVGIGGIVYDVRIGDPAMGWYADHLHPGVTISNTDEAKQIAFNVLSCIGNKIKVIKGEAKGTVGYIIGKSYLYPSHSYRLIADFNPDDLNKLAIGDKVEVEALGVGLEIEGFEDIKVQSLDPNLIKRMDIYDSDGKLSIPVVKVLPGELMGVGVGRSPPEAGAWDIQSCSPDLNKQYGLNELRFGDMVAVENVDSDWGHGVYSGGIVVGIISHGASDIGGHGLGLTVLFSSKKGNINPVIDKRANVAYYLGIREDISW